MNPTPKPSETERQSAVPCSAWLGCREWWEIDIEKPDGSGGYTTFSSIFETLEAAEAAMLERRSWSERKMRLVRVTNARQPNGEHSNTPEPRA